MQEITSKTVEVKTNDDHRDKYFLVHDGKTIKGFASGETRAAVPANLTMLVGTKDELETEIDKLQLAQEVDHLAKAREEALEKAKQKMRKGSVATEGAKQ